MIREKDLYDSIVSFKRETGKEINLESMEKLIESVNKRYRNGVQFIDLVKEVAQKLELDYKYCEVAFSYFPKNKMKKEESEANKVSEMLAEDRKKKKLQVKQSLFSFYET